MKPTELISRLRSYRILNYAVVIICASVILFFYYSFRYSIPLPPGHWLAWFWNIFHFEFRNHVMGVLLIVPILYAVLTLGWKRSSLVLLVLIICCAPYIINFSFNTYTLFVSFGVLLFPAIILIGTELESDLRRRERIAIAEKEREREVFLEQILNVQENERKRIAQELHDSVIQTMLVNTSLVHNLIETHVGNNAALKADLKAIEDINYKVVHDIRRICRALRPSILDNLGLVSAIKWLIDSFSEETGISLNFSFEGMVYELASEENVALFRIIEEILNNIKRHAKASIVDIYIGFLDSAVSIRIKDNGRGFDLPKSINSLALSGKLGILGMHERAKSIGATLEIISNVSAGTEVRISLERKKKFGFSVAIA